jgi:hypothetical protein
LKQHAQLLPRLLFAWLHSGGCNSILYLQWITIVDCFYTSKTKNSPHWVQNELLQIFHLETALLLFHRSASCQHVYMSTSNIECCIFRFPTYNCDWSTHVTLIVAKSHFLPRIKNICSQPKFERCSDIGL